MQSLARFSLANRALIALMTIFVLAFGLLSTGALKQELIPRCNSGRRGHHRLRRCVTGGGG